MSVPVLTSSTLEVSVLSRLLQRGNENCMSKLETKMGERTRSSVLFADFLSSRPAVSQTLSKLLGMDEQASPRIVKEFLLMDVSKKQRT